MINYFKLNSYTILFALILSMNLPGLAAADALDRLRDYARETRSLSGQFSQTVFDRAGRKTQESSGEFFFIRPGKFRWVYRKPYEQLIVGDGNKVWIYDADLEQVTIKRQDSSLGESPAALLAGSNDLEKLFNLSDAGIKDGAEWLEARPKNPDGGFAQIRLGFRGSQLAGMELLDNFGQLSVLKFSKLRANSNLKSELFRFTPPKGVDVIEP